MIRTVAWHEFWFTIRKKSYYLVTLGMPLLVLGYFGLIMLIVLMTVPSEISRMGKPIGLIDRTGVLTAAGAPLSDAVLGEEFEVETGSYDDDIPKEIKQFAGDSNIQSLRKEKIILLDSVETARPNLEDESWKGLVVIPEDYIETGKIEVYSRRSELLGKSLSTGWISRLVRNEILKKTTLTENEVNRIRDSASATKFEINKNGEFEEVNLLSKGLSLGVPLAVAGLLVLALMMNASALLASIAEEKENKVMEVIVSSVSADHLLFGKVLGIVCAGLLQIAIWMAMVSVIPIILQTVMNDYVDYDFNVGQLMISGVFMVTGFMFYGSLLAGMGSLGSTYKDCQQLSAAVIICACVPMMLMHVFISDPNAIVPKVLSMIPFFSPVGMTLRLGAGDIAMWEVGLSLLLLIISTWFAVKIAARLFRAGTLMRGKPPGIREIWKVLTQAA